MNQRLKDIIELETFLFHGVPEHKRRKAPEPVCEPDGKAIEQITVNFETGEITFKDCRSEG